MGILVNTTDTYGRAILRGVMRYANLHRRWLLYKDLERVFDIRTQWPDLDGGIFAGVPASVVEYGLKHCRHLVYCSGGGDPTVCPVVALDSHATGTQAAEHLINCRLERFAFYGGTPDNKATVSRLEGFRSALQKRGFSCIECSLPNPTPEQRASHSHRPALIRWLHELPKPVGIMAFDDTAAHDLSEACLEADIGVPDHIAIVGVNNDDLLCESAWPPLSSVEADFTRMGYAAARILDRLFAGEKLSREERFVLLPPLGVVQRQSTSTLAISDHNLASAVRFIREHACEPCTVHDVLRAVPVGRRWLERQFVSQLGHTPHDEITRVRIETAQRLLIRSDLDMLEVASLCGFSELKSFYLAFRKVTQTTPAAYRRTSLSKA